MTKKKIKCDEMKLEKDRGFVEVPFKFAPDIMHVGLHRTGTSYCQKILFPLLSADVKYFTQSEVKLRGLTAIAGNLQSIASIRQSVNASKKILLSQESYLGGLDFYDFTNVSKLKKIKPKLKIIVTIRSQRQLIPSLYFQKLKAYCYRDSLSEFCKQIVDSKKLDYYFLACRLFELFKRDEVLFVFAEDIFEKPEQVVYEISQFIGVSEKKWTQAKKFDVVVNPRPGRSDILAFYLFNKLSRKLSKTSRVAKMFLALLSKLVRVSVPLFPQLMNKISVSALTEKHVVSSYKASNSMFFQEIKKPHNPHYFK
jgi:hypothetical protein